MRPWWAGGMFSAQHASGKESSAMSAPPLSPVPSNALDNLANAHVQSARIDRLGRVGRSSTTGSALGALGALVLALALLLGLRGKREKQGG